MLWDSIAEENNSEMTMDFTSCQLPRNLDTHRRLNMDMSMHDMVIDEMSFYCDERQEDGRDNHHPHNNSNNGVVASSQHNRLRHAFADIPQPMGLLSPEGSPRRFQIVEKPGTHKFRQPLGTNAIRQQKLHNANSNSHSHGSTSTNAPTPTKTLRVFHSLSSSSSMESSMDDDYMELFEMESLEQSMSSSSLLKFPSDLNSLISGQIKSSSPANRFGVCGNGVSMLQQQQQLLRTPDIRRPPVRRCLSMTENNQQPKTPEALLKQVQETATSMCMSSPYTAKLSISMSGTPTSCFKRPDPPSTTNSPVQIKRYRGDEKENLNESVTSTLALAPGGGCHKVGHHPPTLRKCMSMNDADIMSALARSDDKDEPDLIGDFSKPFVLPLMEGRHRDLKSISCNTMARLLRGDFDDRVANFKIIDCRYPYEYEGGHIRGAQNLYTHEQIIEEFLTPEQKTEQQVERAATADGKRNIIIFHCEFSSERGPKLSRFLRNNDRARNTSSYPALDYPEIYLLHNGYKEFFEQHAELCDPHAYRPMLEPAYNSAYRHFRAKSKSWNGDGLGGATSRIKKSRSRLML